MISAESHSLHHVSTHQTATINQPLYLSSSNKQRGTKRKRSEKLWKSAKTINDNRNRQFCYVCKRYNHRQEECRTRIQENQPCTDKQGQKYWPKRYTTSKSPQGEISPISALTGFLAVLTENPMVIPKLILNFVWSHWPPVTNSSKSWQLVTKSSWD